MKALIDPTTPAQHIVSWTLKVPTWADYPDSARVCQVQADTFPVSAPLFWADCADNVVPDTYWYSTATQTFAPVQNEPYPGP